MASLTSRNLNEVDNGTMHLINGYIQESQQYVDHPIPNPVNVIVMAFYFVFAKFKFDICTRHKDIIKYNGKVIHLKSDSIFGSAISAGCSHAVKTGNLVFKIKSDYSTAPELSIGITTSIKNCQMSNRIVSFLLGRSYNIDLNHGWSGRSKWKQSDVMRLEWNSED